jgi:hypothetical protein
MPDVTFNTTSGQTIKRELLVAYLNTSTTSTAVWSPLGKRVTDSEQSYDWGEDSSQDILGNTWTTMKKPTITQDFDPYDLDGGDVAALKIWNMAVKDQDYTKLAAQDMLIVHLYAGTADTAMFAERYEACSIRPSSLGGEGGGNLGMPISVTYGGQRTTGTAAVSSAGVVTFTPDT